MTTERSRNYLSIDPKPSAMYHGPIASNTHQTTREKHMSTLLEITVKRWADVIEENERDKALITPEQLKTWEDFERKTTAKLKTIIENFDGQPLSDTDSDWLKDLGTTIENSKRVSRDELEAQKAEREEKERLRIQEEKERKEAEERKQAEVVQTKGRLFDMLGAKSNAPKLDKN